MTTDPSTVAARERGRAVEPESEEETTRAPADLKAALDIDTWSTGLDWEGAIERLREEIAAAVIREGQLERTTREKLLRQLNEREGAPPEAGVYRAEPDEIAAIHEGLLFCGRVEAVDGTNSTHDTLPLGITQLGIAVVSYGGTAATFSHRLFRRELTSRNSDPVEQVMSVIDQRQGAPGVGQREGPPELLRRAIMTYAERKVLVDRSTAHWRIGHGQPAPYELITGAGVVGKDGEMEVLTASVGVLRRMILELQRFVFVASAPNERAVLTIGNALSAGEYVIINTLESKISDVVEKGKYNDRSKKVAKAFVEECGPEVLWGVYRASIHAPPYLFYAHRKQVHLAVGVAIADSILRGARGFPMLIDVADVTCRSAFSTAAFYGLIHDAYSQAGAPFKYLGEREMRG
jgi:hypothetical protein